MLPALPVPPRSVIIERFPPLPEKPRTDRFFSCSISLVSCLSALGDIIIERWLPYGPRPERKTIVEEATAAVAYAEPRNKIIVYEGLEPRVNRKFEKGPVVEGDPYDYAARYGTSLLDSETLIQLARNAGVFEDLVRKCSVHMCKKYKQTSNSSHRHRMRWFVKVSVTMIHQGSSEVSIFYTLWIILERFLSRRSD